MAVIRVEREGVLHYSWEAFGRLRRAQNLGGFVTLPTGNDTVVGEGFALTRWGARRRARRALRRWT